MRLRVNDSAKFTPAAEVHVAPYEVTDAYERMQLELTGSLESQQKVEDEAKEVSFYI